VFANALFVSMLVVLVAAALALRLATGPIVQLKDGDTLYALAKAGPTPIPLAPPVEMAATARR
jgi:hypothetical protein